MSNLEKLREAVLNLTYLEMMIFASWFSNTDRTPEQEGDDAFWAYTISDWSRNAEFFEGEDSTALASAGEEHHAE